MAVTKRHLGSRPGVQLLADLKRELSTSVYVRGLPIRIPSQFSGKGLCSTDTAGIGKSPGRFAAPTLAVVAEDERMLGRLKGGHRNTQNTDVD